MQAFAKTSVKTSKAWWPPKPFSVMVLPTSLNKSSAVLGPSKGGSLFNLCKEYANLFDLVVGASALYGGSWQEGSGAVFAENQALRWISDLAGLPQSAGGVFVQGGTIGNLSALVVAREEARKKHKDITKWAIACSEESHSSLAAAAKVMDVELLKIKPNENQRLTGQLVDEALNKYHQDKTKKVFVIVATAGTTNLGIIDDLLSE